MVKLQRYITRHGMFYTCHNDIVFIDNLSHGRVFEEDIIITTIVPILRHNKPKVILDIGGHIGSHTVLYSKYIPNVKIHTFEPQKVLYDILNMNIQANQLSNVATYNVAVGHQEGSCTMSSMLYDGYNVAVDYDTEQFLNYGGISLGAGGEAVRMITVDSLHLDQCDYIKIDVEGAEPLVLEGAIETIRRHKPVILFECNCKSVTPEMRESLGISHERVIDSAVTILQREGYLLKKIPGDNVLAIPASVVGSPFLSHVLGLPTLLP